MREAQRLRKLDLEVEISKLANKHRYEKMGQGDNIENLKDSEIAEALKEIDAERARERVERQIFSDNSENFSRIRPTEMKFNTKVNPPSEASIKSEAAILV